MNNDWVEIAIGAVVIAVAAVFLSFAYSHADQRPSNGYEVSARFDRVDGIRAGTDVRVSGIKVGTVTKTTLDKKTFQAVVSITLAPDLQVPVDSSLKVASEGLLGGVFLAIEPGGDDQVLTQGGQIKYTQGSIDLIGLVSKTMFGTGNSASGAKTPAAPSP
jgi:phospholipid/cholesterol/gamma-HCH transport system substrate-binding protein